jgi:serine/threonine protein kinase
MSFATLKVGQQLRGNKGQEPYRIQGLLGDGGYSNVWKATRDNKEYALKVYRKDEEFDKWGKEELQFLEKAKGLENVVQLKEYFKYDGRHIFVFDIYDICLTDYIEDNDVPLEEKKYILLKVLNALKGLHDREIIHGDIKTDNVLINSKTKEVVLIDLSLSLNAGKDNQGIHIQTVFFRSPEIILGTPMSIKTDIWSLGCMIYKMIVGHKIFNCDRYLNDPDSDESEEESEDSGSSEDSDDSVEGFKEELRTLHEMIEYLGPIPKELTQNGYFTEKYCLKNGRILFSDQIKKHKSVYEDLDFLNEDDRILFEKIIMGCLRYRPSDRMNIQTIMKLMVTSS